jgi:hypothetical protein
VELETLRARVADVELAKAEEAAYGRGVAAGLRLRAPSGGVCPDELGAGGSSLLGLTDTLEATAAATPTVPRTTVPRKPVPRMTIPAMT